MHREMHFATFTLHTSVETTIPSCDAPRRTSVQPPKHRGGGAEFAPDGRCSAHVVAPRRVRRDPTANRRSNRPRGDLRSAKIDDFLGRLSPYAGHIWPRRTSQRRSRSAATMLAASSPLGRAPTSSRVPRSALFTLRRRRKRRDRRRPGAGRLRSRVSGQRGCSLSHIMSAQVS